MRDARTLPAPPLSSGRGPALRSAPRLLLCAFLALLGLLAAQEAPGPERVVRLAAGERPAELAFRVLERGGGPIPARLTFVPEGGGTPVLFAHTDAAPRELAARDNVLYSRTGAGCISVPPGRYTVVASRGLEWSLAERALTLVAGERESLELELVHELDTTGWVGGDFHLHTRTYSGHGDANVEERLLACLGEGLDFAVATDHDHHTDYGPTLRALGLEGQLATLTGNEVTTPIGHFNAFPLDPARAPVDSAVTDANALFRLLRAEVGPSGVVPVIQLNHPRLEGLDYFGRTGLDPVTGTSLDPAYARDFDSIEVLNDNRARGYHDPVTGGRTPDGNLHSVLADWFHLLDLGERHAAVGNSDSHHVRAIVAGYPRNFVPSAAADPAGIRAADLAEAVRAKRLFTTTGPFLELTVEGVGLGGTAQAVDGHARLSVRVRAASWVDCDRVRVFVNAAPFATLPVPATRAPLRLEHELELCLLGTCARHERAREPGGAFDAWVVVAVEGDDALTPVLDAEARPLALSNPIWIEGDGDGAWRAPRARIAAELAAQATPEIARGWFARLTPPEQAHALALVPRGPFAAALLEGGLHSEAREVRLAAAHACRRVAVTGAVPGVQRAWSANTNDPFLGALLVRALAAARAEQAPASLAAYAERFGPAAVRRYASELAPLLVGADVQAWRVLGPFGVESAAGQASTAPPANDGEWRALGTLAADGYADLKNLAPGQTDGTLVYAQAFLRVDAARAVPCAFGSDDGARIWLGERLVYENRARKSASPLETLLTLPLEPGWNRVVLAIENGTGEFGFYFRLLDAAVEIADAPR